MFHLIHHSSFVAAAAASLIIVFNQFCHHRSQGAHLSLKGLNLSVSANLELFDRLGSVDHGVGIGHGLVALAVHDDQLRRHLQHVSCDVSGLASGGEVAGGKLVRAEQIVDLQSELKHCIK